MTDACPTCGAVPDWHLLYRRKDWPAGEPQVYWRIVTRHLAARRCSRFNQGFDFAPLAMELTERQRTGKVVPGSVEDGLARRRQVRVQMGLEPPEYERGDAWEGEEAA